EDTEFLSCYPRNSLIEAVARIGIRPIICRQERVGVGIADGFTRMKRGKVNGVFAAQAGPGIENAFPGVAQAFSENVPILILPGGLGLSRQYQHPTFSAVDVFRPITKMAARAHSVQELPELLLRAYQSMRAGKGGPALIEIPVEVWDQEFEGKLNYDPVPVLRLAPDPIVLKEAAKMLVEAKNPLLWAGQGILYADASDSLVELSELLVAPVMTTNPGKSSFPENHPLALGASTRSRPRMVVDYMRKADVVCAIGSSLTKTPFGPGIPLDKKIIHATNDAMDINKDFRSEISLLGDACLVIEGLILEIRALIGEADSGKLDYLITEISKTKKQWLSAWEKQFKSDEVPINQYRIINDLLDTLDPDNIIITHDSGSPREQLLPFWESSRPGSYIGWGKSTQLGYGLGVIIGAKLAEPEKLCINIMGDSAIGMTGMDLETAARYGIGILTIVFNNGVMAAERDVLIEADKRFGAMTVGGNYTIVAEGLGVASCRVQDPNDFLTALKSGIKVTESGAPFLIECLVKEGREFSRDHLPGL
ncbi:MAG: thiamine pyrophosphate-requiring protein, partial [Pseudomonadota bacterium]|nr:thiamine pyrophosphate-requiring protein [Pseudomonadota bacterium]